MNSSQTLRTMKSKNPNDSFEPDLKHYGIPYHSPLTYNRIMSILFYTDYSKLCTKFSGTFRKQTKFETNENLKNRHRNYWNWSKLLNETIHCWGYRLNYYADKEQISILYHGESFIHFNGFVTKFMSPTSRTTEIEVNTLKYVILYLYCCVLDTLTGCDNICISKWYNH